MAPLVLDGAINGTAFLACIEQMLCTMLHVGDIVICYSPDLNLIELAFSKLKRLLRSAAARTVETLWNAIGQLISLFGPNECANYFFRHCGYPHSGR